MQKVVKSLKRSRKKKSPHATGNHYCWWKIHTIIKRHTYHSRIIENWPLQKISMWTKRVPNCRWTLLASYELRMTTRNCQRNRIRNCIRFHLFSCLRPRLIRTLGITAKKSEMKKMENRSQWPLFSAFIQLV